MAQWSFLDLSPMNDLIALVRARTPARLLVGRAGPAYHTACQLELRQDHAAAVDAVHDELDLIRDFGQAFIDRWKLIEVSTMASGKQEYLMRPDLGRKLHPQAVEALKSHCPTGMDIQVVIGDGLSVAAVQRQVPVLLPLLENETRSLGMSFGRPFFIRYCRVGIVNGLGEILDPKVVVLLLGERPGLATAESLSAYMAFKPRPGHTDARRNLISNIHLRGVSWELAAKRIRRLAMQMIEKQTSGVEIKEEGLAALENISPKLISGQIAKS